MLQAVVVTDEKPVDDTKWQALLAARFLNDFGSMSKANARHHLGLVFQKAPRRQPKHKLTDDYTTLLLVFYGYSSLDMLRGPGNPPGLRHVFFKYEETTHQADPKSRLGDASLAESLRRNDKLESCKHATTCYNTKAACCGTSPASGCAKS